MAWSEEDFKKIRAKMNPDVYLAPVGDSKKYDAGIEAAVGWMYHRGYISFHDIKETAAAIREYADTGYARSGFVK